MIIEICFQKFRVIILGRCFLCLLIYIILLGFWCEEERIFLIKIKKVDYIIRKGRGVIKGKGKGNGKGKEKGREGEETL